MTVKKAVSDLLQKVLMVPPKHFTVEYAINPWMGGVVNKDKAMQQWNDIKCAIEKEGVKVLTLEPVKGLPDMVFVCNSGIVLRNEVYLSHFRHPERTGEQAHYLDWFKINKYRTFGEDYADFFEGGGDACFSDYDTLWAGFGPRTNKNILKRLPESIAVSDKEATAFVCNAITIRKTVISPIGVEQPTRDALKNLGYTVVEVDMSEFMKSGGACQCLVLKL